jgi:hypothetical protein
VCVLRGSPGSSPGSHLSMRRVVVARSLGATV